MYFSNDPVRDAERHYQECEERTKKLPKCADCGEPITDDVCYQIFGEYICEGCLRDNYMKHTCDIEV